MKTKELLFGLGLLALSSSVLSGCTSKPVIPIEKRVLTYTNFPSEYENILIKKQYVDGAKRTIVHIIQPRSNQLLSSFANKGMHIDSELQKEQELHISTFLKRLFTDFKIDSIYLEGIGIENYLTDDYSIFPFNLDLNKYEITLKSADTIDSIDAMEYVVTNIDDFNNDIRAFEFYMFTSREQEVIKTISSSDDSMSLVIYEGEHYFGDDILYLSKKNPDIKSNLIEVMSKEYDSINASAVRNVFSMVKKNLPL